jgi:hypothetical protein
MTASQARAFLRKSEEYLASATDDLAVGRYTPAAGGAIHAGISAKDAIVMALAGSVTKHKDHSQAAAELRTALGKRTDAAAAERSLRLDTVCPFGEGATGVFVVVPEPGCAVAEWRSRCDTATRFGMLVCVTVLVHAHTTRSSLRRGRLGLV